MTNQLVAHLSNEEEWLKEPYGFNHLYQADPDADPLFSSTILPPPGWQDLPFHEEQV